MRDRHERTSAAQHAASAWRLAQIATAGVWHGLRFGARVLFRRGSVRWALGQSLAECAEQLGPTFLKIAQILSSRPDLLSPELTAPLARLQDQVRPFDSRRIPALIEAAFGRRIDDLFSRFDLEPVSAASIAHVHRATLKDGRTVAVKIRRPGIDTIVRRDFRLLRLLARCGSALPMLRVMPLQELVEEIAAPILLQLDFVQEAAANRALRRNLQSSEDVTIPALVDVLCTESVLTMEFLDDLQKVTGDVLDVLARRRAALAGLRALYRMIFLNGVVHADLHPGNFFVRPFGRVAILDTGLVIHLSEDTRRDFVDFFFGIVNDEGDVCARIVYDGALWRAPWCDRDAFGLAMRRLVSRYAALKSRDFEVTAFVFELLETQRRFGIRGSTSFIMTVLAMVVYDGICKQLHPECDFQAEARGYLITARYQRARRLTAAPRAVQGESVVSDGAALGSNKAATAPAGSWMTQ
jgi:ubiquinone biosynthesis protein